MAGRRRMPPSAGPPTRPALGLPGRRPRLVNREPIDRQQRDWRQAGGRPLSSELAQRFARLSVHEK